MTVNFHSVRCNDEILTSMHLLPGVGVGMDLQKGLNVTITFIIIIRETTRGWVTPS